MNISLLVSSGLEADLRLCACAYAFLSCPGLFHCRGNGSADPQGPAVCHTLGKTPLKHVAYPIAVVTGLLLAVCSCTVLPLFAGIRKGGAGIGPAIAFLYTAPATNIVAILYTGSLIGWDVAVARIFFSVLFAVSLA